LKLDAFKLKARSLSADVRRRLGPLAELAKDLGGPMSVRCSRNLFESEDAVEVKFVLDVKVTVGEEDVLDARFEIHANRNGEKKTASLWRSPPSRSPRATDEKVWRGPR